MRKKDSDGNCFFADIGDTLTLKQVILGVRCEDKKQEEIKKTALGYNDIEIIKARLDFETFKVVEDKEAR